MGRLRGSTDPDSGSERAAGTAEESMAAGSPRKARETVVGRWNRVPHATPSPAGTGESCGSRRRHAGP